MYFNNLKSLRTDRDFTQEDVASMLDCKRSRYCTWENGLIMIPIEMADKLTLLYNVRLSYLLGLEKSSMINYKIREMNYNILLSNLLKLKESNNHTFEQIAEHLNCNRSTCCRYFDGSVKIPVDRLILLAGFYHIDLDKLCGKE